MFKNSKDLHQYDDIINLPRPESSRHPHMSDYDRAAQFSPFSALTGYEDCINEAARITEERIEIDENQKNILNEQLKKIKENIKKNPEITITYFKPDEKKKGGLYITETGAVKKIDEYNRKVCMIKGECIQIEDITDICINTEYI